MDGSSVAFVLPVVRTTWNLSSEQTGLL